MVEPTRVRLKRRLERALAVRQGVVAAPGRGQVGHELRIGVQVADPARAAEPLLAGGRVEVAAEGLHVERDRAKALCAVEDQKRGRRRDRIRVHHLSGGPRDVRGHDEASVSPHLVRQVREGHDAHPGAANVARGRDRAKHSGVLLVAREDLVAGLDVDAQRGRR